MSKFRAVLGCFGLQLDTILDTIFSSPMGSHRRPLSSLVSEAEFLQLWTSDRRSCSPYSVLQIPTIETVLDSVEESS